MLEIPPSPQKKLKQKIVFISNCFSRKVSFKTQDLFPLWCRHACFFFVIHVSIFLLVFRVDGQLFVLLCPGFVFCSFIVLLYDYSLQCWFLFVNVVLQCCMSTDVQTLCEKIFLKYTMLLDTKKWSFLHG